jgi:hypothetical protein
MFKLPVINNNNNDNRAFVLIYDTQTAAVYKLIDR